MYMGDGRLQSSSSDYWAGLFKSVISSTRLGVVVAHSVSKFKTIYSVKSVEKVSGYSTMSDLKASSVGADTVLAGRMFHSLSLIVIGTYEFGSTWSVYLSWNSWCWPLGLWFRHLSPLSMTLRHWVCTIKILYLKKWVI